jgi:nucleotide-binding universal stress UspA family protein
MSRIRTILHPTDFSENASPAFQYACNLARDYDARLVVVYAMEPVAALVGEGGLVTNDLDERREVARRQLAAVQPTDPAVRMERVIREGPAPGTILDVAAEQHADLIVMGTHGRTGIGRLVLGSVAEWVLRKAPCPVLTVKAPTQADLDRVSAKAPAEQTSSR